MPNDMEILGIGNFWHDASVCVHPITAYPVINSKIMHFGEGLVSV